jgi:hypothetical protein
MSLLDKAPERGFVFGDPANSVSFLRLLSLAFGEHSVEQYSWRRTGMNEKHSFKLNSVNHCCFSSGFARQA